MKYLVAVMTRRAKKPQFIGFDNRPDAHKFMLEAMKAGWRVSIYKQLNPRIDL